MSVDSSLGLSADIRLQGCVYLLSTWYVRYDMGKRYSVFYLLGVVASAFSGILAFGLMQMNGLAGMGGWRYDQTIPDYFHIRPETNVRPDGSSSSKAS